MAPAVPVLATIGGGSAVTGGIILGATVASAGLAINQNLQEGRIAKAEADIKVNAEGDAARQREIDRKRALQRSISARQAEAGARGVAFSEGSAAAITNLDISELQDDLQVDRANTRQRQAMLRSQGRAAKMASRAKAVGTLLDTVKGVAQMSAGAG